MGTPDRRTAARQRAAEQKRQLARKKRQQQVFTVLGVVVLAFVLLVVMRLAGVGEKKAPAGTLDAATLAKVTDVPASTFAAVGDGGTKQSLIGLPGPDLTKDGKPRVLYIGAEYCPYCAAQRWAVVTALSRFGTWKGLTETHSALDDAFAGTPTFSFHGASFSSKYLLFEGVETETNQRGVNGQYGKLDTPTKEQEKLFGTYDRPPYIAAELTGAIPFLDLGNRYMISGASFSPSLLSNLTLAKIANDLGDPKNDIAKGVLGSANRITAALCQLTNDKPAAVCTAAPIPALRQALPRG